MDAIEGEDESLGYYRELLAILELALRACEAGMTPPQAVRFSEGDSDGYMPRMVVRDVRHAMLLKQAATLHYLHAGMTLCETGLFMAQGAMQRMADEAIEDVCFLAEGIIDGLTPLHEEFLKAFWSDHDEDTGDATTVQKAATVRRARIHAALSAKSDDPSRAGLVAKRIHKTYSGFVHAASANVMDLYDPYNHTFVVSGGPEYHRESQEYDFWNYLYRAVLSFMAAARAYGSDSLFNKLEEAVISFQRVTGRQGGYRDRDKQ